MSYLVKTPATIQSLFPSLTWIKPSKEKVIYLTFDDGPIPNVSEWVLNLLNEYKAKATFFCIGSNVQKHPEIYSKIIAGGHSVGNHTMNHEDGWKTSNSDYFQTINECSKYVDSILFRPPYGKVAPSQIKHLKGKFDIVMWDVMPGDFDLSVSEVQCWENIKNNTEPGSIIVLHDSIKAEKNLRYVLPKVLEYFTKYGYRFEKL